MSYMVTAHVVMACAQGSPTLAMHARCQAVGVIAHIVLACIAYAVMADLVMACAQGSPTLAMSHAEQSELWPMQLWPV